MILLTPRLRAGSKDGDVRRDSRSTWFSSANSADSLRNGNFAARPVSMLHHRAVQLKRNRLRTSGSGAAASGLHANDAYT